MLQNSMRLLRRLAPRNDGVNHMAPLPGGVGGGLSHSEILAMKVNKDRSLKLIAES
jgi:hypothetical protein